MKANNLKILIVKNGETVVDISMPAVSSKWIIDLLPEDTLKKISEKGIDILKIQERLNQSSELQCQELFQLETEEKKIRVWLG